jgi:hypothetical protein
MGFECGPMKRAREELPARRFRPGSMTDQIVTRTALGPRNIIVSRHSIAC